MAWWQQLATLSSAKTLGGIGSILSLLSFIPYAGGVLAIVGLIMTLVAVKYIADIVAEPKIFTNILIGVILAIAGVIVGVVAIIGTVFSFMGLGAFSGFSSYTSGTVPPPGVFAFIGTLILGLVIIWIVFIISAVFVRKSYSEISKRLNVGIFGTAALLYLIGAALTIILVGFIIIFVANILLIVGFFSLPDQLPQPMMGTTTYSPPPPPPPPPPPTA